jgi:hypothetical protein
VICMKKGYINEMPSKSCENSDGEDESDIPGEAAGGCPVAIGGCGSSRNSSITSSNDNERENFVVMKRRNAYIQMDPGSVADPQEISRLLPPPIPPNLIARRTRKFSLQF